MDQKFVTFWLSRDKERWIAGVIAGLLAGLFAFILAKFIAERSGLDGYFPLKLMASVLLGSEATDFNHPSSALIGLCVWEGLCTILGFIFSHFVFAQSLLPLLSMGFVWGIFSWIFIWNLFSQSFYTFYSFQLSPWLILPICLTFGLSLAILKPLESMIKKIN